ncbi:hypothetical protein J2125_004212 [Erwinia toletana]|uniref:Transposase n=1 Tax=Winslowiella toletana TaxID=92490 RepID=A0ABS4PEG3_9GAMM|nr:hypothetical protein [Winslowiella toletana]
MLPRFGMLIKMRSIYSYDNYKSSIIIIGVKITRNICVF